MPDTDRGKDRRLPAAAGKRYAKWCVVQHVAALTERAPGVFGVAMLTPPHPGAVARLNQVDALLWFAILKPWFSKFSSAIF
jgi:hypothetical protein